MKKLMFGLVVSSCLMGLIGCSTTNQSTKQSTVESTDDSVAKENKKMEEMKEDLLSKDVSIHVNELMYAVVMTREKGINQEYFEMISFFDGKKNDIVSVKLQLKGSIDGEKKPRLKYDVTQNNSIVEAKYDSDINSIASILKELDYSDKELVEFIKWYYENFYEEETTETTK